MSADERVLFEAELKLLPQIGYVARGFVGKPAATTERPVTDHSFDFSLMLEFRTMAEHEFYQADCQDHKRFVDTCKAFFDRVIVYDSDVLGWSEGSVKSGTEG